MKSNWCNGKLKKKEVPENLSHQESNHGSCGQETPKKSPDDASNVCESSNTCTFSEFLMIILTNFCGGITFHHLWDHKILSRSDDWIRHVSEVRFGNRSRIEIKLYVYTQIVQSSICEFWTSIAQMAATLSEDHEVFGPKSGRGNKKCKHILIVRSDSFSKLTQLSKRTWNACNNPLTIIFPCRGMVRTRDCCVPRATKYSLNHRCDIPLKLMCRMLCIYCKFHWAILLQWKWMVNEHQTIRVLKALPEKGIHKNLKFQVEFNWYQPSVCWNISTLHYRGTNHPKSRVQVHSYWVILYSSTVFVFASPLYLKGTHLRKMS